MEPFYKLTQKHQHLTVSNGYVSIAFLDIFEEINEIMK